MGRVRRRTLLVPLLAGLLAPALPALPALPAAAADAGFVVYALDTPDLGSDTLDAAAGDTVTAYVGSDRALVVSGYHPNIYNHWVAVRPGAATTLRTGTYTVGAGISVDHSGCSSTATTGTVAITELTSDAAGQPATLALSYDVTCAGSRRLTGTARYHSAAAWAGVRTAGAGPFAVVKGRTGTRTATITGTGPTPVTLGAATVGGSGGAAFAVTANGCAGVTLTAGASCSVTLSFAPAQSQYYTALLSLAADTPRGAVLHPLGGRGVVPPPAPTDVRAVAGDDGVGLTWAWVHSTWEMPAVTEYRVYRDDATVPVATVTTPSYVDPAAPGETHSYRVTAAGEGVEGAASTAQQATVPAAPTDGTGPVTGVAWTTPDYDAGTATPSVTGTAGTLTLRAGSHHEVVIRPLSGAAWAPGTVRADVVAGGCTVAAVPLTVTEARVHANGTPVTLALSGRASCPATTVDFDVRYAATTPLHAPDVSPDEVGFATTAPGGSTAPAAVTVTNHGSVPLELGAPVVPAHWRVDSNTCAVVAPAASCTLAVAFAPTASGAHAGVLTLPDNSPRGHRRVALRGESRAIPGPVRDLRATALVGRVVLEFAKPEHEYPAAASYVAEWATAKTGPWQRAASSAARRLVHSYAGVGRRLYYRVRAVNSEGAGPYVHTSALTTGRELLYAADTGSGLYHLTARGVPGSNTTRFSTSPRDEEDPSFHSTGAWVVFTREDFPGRWHIHYGKASGASVVKLVGDVGGVPWTYRNPRWSPNAAVLSYACRPVTRSYWDLCVRDGYTGKVRIVPGVLADGGHWLPGGKELVVVSATSPPTIQVVAPDNSYRIAIPGTSDARDVAVSPDGSRIAWTRYEGTEGDAVTGGGSRRSLRVSPMSGGAGIVLRGTGYSNDPEWSVDGESLYFTYGERTPGVPLRRDVWSARAVGGGLVNLTNTPAVDEDNVTMRDAVTPVPSPQAARALQDFTGDGKADIAVFRPGTGAWRIRGVAKTTYWGRLGDIPVAGDYNGDKKAERAVFRPSDGTWRIQGRLPVTYGRRGDVPVPADYNGDGKTDIGVFRPSDGTWRIQGRTPVAYGRRGDVPVPADYNGDKKAEIGVYRNGSWLVRGRGRTWGTMQGAPAPGDFLGTGRAQYAVLDGNEWRADHYLVATVPRTFNDVPAYGNFNGDRRLEPGVFNSTLGLWRILGQSSVVWGRPGDVAV